MMDFVKSWQETSRVFAEAARLLAAGEPVALATLVRIAGSSYRRAGAKLLVRADGTVLGQVSGGCLENDLRERAQRLLAAGAQTEWVHYDTGTNEDTLWGMGLGCGGSLDIWLQRLAAAHADAVASINRALAGADAFAIRTRLDGPEPGRLTVGPRRPGEATGIATEGDARVFVDALDPPPDLIVVGAGEDSVPLVQMAALAGFRVTLVDHRAAYLRDELFPHAHARVHIRPEHDLAALPIHARTYVVIKNHALALDRAWARAMAGTPAPYIGLMGPRTRREEIVAGLSAETRARVYGPVGLDVGAEGAEQIAISIVAELLAFESGRSGGHLRERSAPLHG